jgi:hypothetical protein
MNTTLERPHRLWWLAWLTAFLGFPPGGLLANAVIGRLDTPIEGIVGGALAGAVIGLAQHLALRRALDIRISWVLLTSAGFAVGSGLSVLLFGAETSVEATLLRALLTGLMLGIAQWFMLRGRLPAATVWIPAVTLFYPTAWYITAQVIRQNMDQGFVIFGASGALFFQAALGVVLWMLLRRVLPTTRARAER